MILKSPLIMSYKLIVIKVDAKYFHFIFYFSYYKVKLTLESQEKEKVDSAWNFSSREFARR